ncbi:MAG: hypothetical protein K2O49_02660 [Muribaculaceae bacterium]|nr:hypothetical protein [Muribaculaceae bacterium]
MKEFIIFTTEGITYGPNTDEEVENCQVLGIIHADTESEAIDKLFDDNEWIHAAGFSKDYLTVRQLLPSSTEEI